MVEKIIFFKLNKLLERALLQMIKKNSETELKVYSIQKEDEDSTKNLFKNEYFRGAFF